MSSYFDRYEGLRFDRPAERVLRIAVNRPDDQNIVHAALHTELSAVWREVDADASVSSVILTGTGDTFSAGGDIGMARALADSFEARARTWKEARDIVYNVIDCSKPIVSAMRGLASGPALAAGLLADISIAARDARLIDAHTRIGTVAGDHAAIIWPLLCGMAKAKYHLLLGKAINGAAAEEIGLVSLAVDEVDLDATALDVAKRLAEGSPIAIRLTKNVLNGWLRAAGPIFESSLALELLSFTSDEVGKGLESLLNKQAPRFDPRSPL